MQVIRQQATITALSNDLKAWEESSVKLAALHKDALHKLQVSVLVHLRWPRAFMVNVVFPQSEIDGRNQEVAHLRRDLSSRPSLSEVTGWRQQLAAYEALYFNVEDTGVPSGDAFEGGTLCVREFFDPTPFEVLPVMHGGVPADDGGIHSSVHAIVLKRVRQLESQLTKASRELEHVATSLAVRFLAQPGQTCKLAYLPRYCFVSVVCLQASQKEALEAHERIADQKQLIEKLENALEDQTGSPKLRMAPTAKSAPTGSFSHDSQLRALLGEWEVHAPFEARIPMHLVCR